MIYEFNCEHCNKQFEVSLPMADCQKPLKEPCPLCEVSGKVFRVYGLPEFQTNMMGTKEKKAGNEWKDVLRKIDSKAGSASKIRQGMI